MQHFKHGLIIFLLNFFSLNVFAFGSHGHQQVGAIADKLLQGTTAEQQVNSLLNGMNLETVAVWADCAKGVTSSDGIIFTYADLPTKFPECNPFNSAEDKSRFEHFAQHNWKQCGATHGHEYCHNQYHYADVSNLHAEYLPTYIGSNDHDIVHSINAAIAVLKDQTPASPFSIEDKKEALMLLTHYVGDIHQPLHVVAIYLDPKGKAIDPDAHGDNSIYGTEGGNVLKDGSESLHHEWDSTPAAMTINGSDTYQLMDKAKQIPSTSGDIFTWSTTWATEAINVGKVAFSGLSFTLAANQNLNATTPKWNVIGDNATYKKRADEIKAQQIAAAGARLAEVLKTIWPDASSASSSSANSTSSAISSTKSSAHSSSSARSSNRSSSSVDTGSTSYLSKSELPDVKLLLPPAPAKNTSALTSDIEIFNATRKILHTDRGQQAANDDVFEPALILEQFKDATGVAITPANAPTLMALIKKARVDGNNLIAPIKLSVANGGRKRPFVQFKDSETCLFPVDMAGHYDVDINQFHLDASGSYPSTHALVGMLVGMVLSESIPSQSDAVLKRGIEFGESRVICGFHYESDVVAGRLAAAILFSRLHAQPEFIKDLNQTKLELQAAINNH